MMKSCHRRLPVKLLISVATLALLPDIAQAADAPGVAADALGEITVTARKREENLQSTPISVAVFGSAALAQQRIEDFSEIAARVPGFTYNPDNVSEPNVFLRGIGTDIESAGANPSIGFFLNDVYLSRAQGSAIELFDLERVEVVRGPQGTLYGKNVVGGAINFVTRKPTDKMRASVEASFGNYKSGEVKASLAGGIAPGLSGSIAVSERRHDGYAYNTFTRSDMEDLQAFGIMGQLRYQPSSDLDILLTGDLTRHRGGGHWIDIQTPDEHNIPFVNPDPRRGPNNIDGHQNANLGGVHLSADWSSDAGTLTSITAYREATFSALNNDGGSFIDFTKLAYNEDGRVNFFAIDRSQFNDDYYVNDKHEKAKTLSQEFRFTSKFDGPFNFLAGLYYLHEDVRRSEVADYIFVDFFAQGSDINHTRVKSDTYAAFVEGTYKFTDTVGLTAGVRYTRDNKRFSVYRQTIGDFLGANFVDANGDPTLAFNASGRDHWSAWTPSVNLHWQATKDIYVYGAASRGYKSGGWNGENATSPAEAVKPYNPEYAWNYEVGIKTEALDHHLRFNLTGFWTEYKDLQTQQFVVFSASLPADNIIANAGKARVRGIEIEATAVPVKGLTLYGSYTYMKGKITGDLISTDLVYTPSCFCNLPVPTNLKGNRLRRTPENAFNIGGDLTLPVSERLNFVAHANYSYTGSFEFDNENSPRTHEMSVGTLDGSFGIATADDRWRLTIWGKNLTNKLYETGKTDVIGSVLVSYAPPRTYGASLSWKY